MNTSPTSRSTGRTTELLAPARDLACGRVAIDCGADAVYIGAPRFGAREAAGNSIEDIAVLTAYAHTYWARVYVTLNTVLFDRELEEAVRLAWRLHEVGVDGLIIQDMGLLESDLPPIPLIASTQTHNHTPERVQFLQSAGFSRAILARELTLGEIHAIRKAAPDIELECFVHGAICVCYSGQCYLSHAVGGRSGNRGQCAQPCRKQYTLTDADGAPLGPRKHYLSLNDLCFADELPALLEAGVTSFKIEGRLKDSAYVANVVSFYRGRLDEAIAAHGLSRSASGTAEAGFAPDLAKTFNRGYTPYFLHGRPKSMGSLDTPKMVGEPVGRVTRVRGTRITLDRNADLHPGDGLCYFDANGELCGVQVNAADGMIFTAARRVAIRPGMNLFRNHDHEFLKRLGNAGAVRKTSVTLTLHANAEGLMLRAEDEDGIAIEHRAPGNFAPADKPAQAIETIERQLGKTGDTPFRCDGVSVAAERPPFVPARTLNALRRDTLDELSGEREAKRPRMEAAVPGQADAPALPGTLSFEANVVNKRAATFYRKHGVEHIEPGAETGTDLRGRRVMTTRYCLRFELGLCPRQQPGLTATPLYLTDDEGHRLRLEFNCPACHMEIYLDPPQSR